VALGANNLDFLVLGMEQDLTCQGANVDGEFVINIFTDDVDGAYLTRAGIVDLIAWLQHAKEWVST
jgi:hypothetical protein